MSEANLEIVRAAVRAFNERDIETTRRIFAPDIVMYAPEGWPEAGPEHGIEAVLQQFERLAADWEHQVMSITGEEAAGDRVVIRLHWDTRSAATGIPMTMDISGVYRLSGGRVKELRFLWDHDAALDAAGLRR